MKLSEVDKEFIERMRQLKTKHSKTEHNFYIDSFYVSGYHLDEDDLDNILRIIDSLIAEAVQVKPVLMVDPRKNPHIQLTCRNCFINDIWTCHLGANKGRDIIWDKERKIDCPAVLAVPVNKNESKG